MELPCTSPRASYCTGEICAWARSSSPDQMESNLGVALSSGWQSFTATSNGLLMAVGLYKNGTSGPTELELSILEGEGDSGAVLYSGTHVLPDEPNAHTAVLAAPTPIEAGGVYTMKIVPSSPPFSTIANSMNPYPYGRSSGGAGEDLWFRIEAEVAARSDCPVECVH